MSEMVLRDAQKIAVETSGRDILVSAGAGTGKTRVLVERVLNFVTSGKALITEILALTFTEKAANEMKVRLLKRLNEMGLESARRDLESAYISTIHAFAARILREHPLEAEIDPEFRIIEPEEADVLKESALDAVIEAECRKGNELFELLKAYGEHAVRDGILKTLEAARHEGKSLKAFFETYQSGKGSSLEAWKAGKLAFSGIFLETEEPRRAEDWKDFLTREWTWETVEVFKAWMSDFSRKRKDPWPAIKTECRELLHREIGKLAEPWRARFEKLALGFEEVYEDLKKENSCLDFNDLEIKAVGLLKREGKVHQRIREEYRNKFRQILVDEFQDTSRLQMELIELLSGAGNLFLVGDFKQSIYGFRGAEPDLFLEKEKQYFEDKKKICIPLVENFRSTPEVIRFINCFFDELWREDQLKFDKLVACGEKVSESGSGVEILRLRAGEDEKTDRGRIREAEWIAAKMEELHIQEKIPYGEMAILFQAVTELGIYENALKARGIPYYALSSRSFYVQPEVRDMISFLSFLENPFSDIALAASLRSPLFQLKEDTLYWLSAAAKKENENTPLYEGVKRCAEIAEISEEEQRKLEFFSQIAGELSVLKDKLRITELLDLILAKTAYDLFVLNAPQGVRRYANLKKLIQIARRLEAFEPVSLEGFLRTLKRFEMQDVQESEAQIEGEQSGRVVRLLSIHRAKGLEFPVVFLADLGRKKQSSDSKLFLAVSGKGYDMQVKNEKTLEMEKPKTWQMIDEEMKRKEKEERKRLFYVAATRAKHRLILSGLHEEIPEEKTSFHDIPPWMRWLLSPHHEALSAASVIIHDGETAEIQRKFLRKSHGINLRKLFEDIDRARQKKPAKTEKSAAREKADEILKRAVLTRRLPARAIDLPVSAYALFSKDPESYRQIYEVGFPDLRENWEKSEREESRQAGDLGAADFGTAIHGVLEKMDFKFPAQSLKIHLHKIFRNATKSDFKEAVKILENFTQSLIFQRLQRARVIKKEIPFVLNERHGTIYGIVDVLFQDENGAWQILDYKTAVGSPEAVRESSYELQLEFYAYAAQQILNVAPEKGMLYYLKNAWAHEVPFTPERLKLIQQKIRKLQEDILTFRNGEKTPAG